MNETSLPGRVVRVLPDLPAVDREFDYLLADATPGAAEVEVGRVVRVPLARRTVRGWVTALDTTPPEGVELERVRKVGTLGPDSSLVELARWAAWRWAGTRPHFLRTATPERAVRRIFRETAWKLGSASAERWLETGVGESVRRGGVSVFRVPPDEQAASLVATVARAVCCASGDEDAAAQVLAVLPEKRDVHRVHRDLRRWGWDAVTWPDGWAEAASGAPIVLGTRAAAWARLHRPAACIVWDEHDEALQQEQAPTWHAREVLLERCVRLRIPLMVASPVPSLWAFSAAKLVRPPREREHEGWPDVEVVDRRREDLARTGLWSPETLRMMRSAEAVVCVVNRRGRARRVVCASCGGVVVCHLCGAPMWLDAEERLVCEEGDDTRPPVCHRCGSTALRLYRPGVTRVKEELEKILGEEVAEFEVHGAASHVAEGCDSPPSARVTVGTEAVLRNALPGALVVFPDFDAELLAPRYRASEEAMVLLARAARMVGGRKLRGRMVVQTNMPDHPVIQAALTSDPSLVSDAEIRTREAMGLPPVRAVAEVSGPGAPDVVAQLAELETVEILGPRGGRWLVKAVTVDQLCDALESISRPRRRVRIAVDPLRFQKGRR
ncbi:MAG: hypothetical protein KatS3mg008_0374 [Acidimicrobiales bacterium]|nr:MAG: hypothetical protein KatS3mg008_0374 [Acidimicrobiales bacterium]